jgi:hypothetical protein
VLAGAAEPVHQSARIGCTKVLVDNSLYHQAFEWKAEALSGLGEEDHPALHRGRAVAQSHAAIIQLETGAPVLA